MSLDLTDLNNWPNGAEACVGHGFKKWIGSDEYYFQSDWIKSGSPLSLDHYLFSNWDVVMRPEELDKLEKDEKEMNAVDSTLEERGNRYGEFCDVADTTQAIKDIVKSGKSYEKLNAYQVEALDMIASKIARIVNGDPDYIDNWHGIAGYSRLVEMELEK